MNLEIVHYRQLLDCYISENPRVSPECMPHMLKNTFQMFYMIEHILFIYLFWSAWLVCFCKLSKYVRIACMTAVVDTGCLAFVI
jgi:hypothetical protein